MTPSLRILDKIEEITNLLRPEDVQPALRRAVADTGRHFIARAARAVGDTVNLSIGDIKAQFRVSNPAGESAPTIIVSIGRKKVPLADYLTSAQISRGLAGITKGGRRLGGVTVRVRKGAGSETHPHAFVTKMKSGHIGVFHRGDKRWFVAGAKRLPIHEEFGPTAVGVLANANDPEATDKTVIDASCEDAGEFLLKQIDQRIAYYLAKYAGKI